MSDQLLLQMSMSINDHAESFNKRLERKDQEIDQLKTIITGLTNQLKEQNHNVESLTRRLERKDEETEKQKSTIADLTNQLKEQKLRWDREKQDLQSRVQSLEASVLQLNEENEQRKRDFQGLLDREEKRVFKE